MLQFAFIKICHIFIVNNEKMFQKQELQHICFNIVFGSLFASILYQGYKIYLKQLKNERAEGT